MLSGRSVSVCVTEGCEHDILTTALGNLNKIIYSVYLGTKISLLDFEVKRSKFKVTTRNLVKNCHIK